MLPIAEPFLTTIPKVFHNMIFIHGEPFKYSPFHGFLVMKLIPNFHVPICTVFNRAPESKCLYHSTRIIPTSTELVSIINQN